MDKTNHGPVIAPSSVQLFHVFGYAGGVIATNLLLLLMICFWNAEKIDTQGALVIIFFDCSDVLKGLRSVFTAFKTTKSIQNSLKAFSLRSSSLKADIFCYFYVFAVRPPQKLTTKRPVFPDYLSVSYDYTFFIEASQTTASKSSSQAGYLDFIIKTLKWHQLRQYFGLYCQLRKCFFLCWGNFGSHHSEQVLKILEIFEGSICGGVPL